MKVARPKGILRGTRMSVPLFLDVLANLKVQRSAGCAKITNVDTSTLITKVGRQRLHIVSSLKSYLPG